MSFDVNVWLEPSCGLNAKSLYLYVIRHSYFPLPSESMAKLEFKKNRAQSRQQQSYVCSGQIMLSMCIPKCDKNLEKVKKSTLLNNQSGNKRGMSCQSY